ncbi:hypothetical protein AAZX31_20G210300 [Glycine max]|nr:hypothetical protein GLYMA_20G224250v4 [Glycine max]KAH1037430.1 hypothetical protein GYH30_056693 [Glycine max]
MVNQQAKYLAGIYASTSHVVCKQLCSDLPSLQDQHLGAWCFIGNFNTILSYHEKRGGNVSSQNSCKDFHAWVEAYSLTHLHSLVPFFTWSNGRRGQQDIDIRLDGSICNEAFISYWDQISCNVLPRSSSDHHLLLLTLNHTTMRLTSSFKFMSMWLEQPQCSKVISDAWRTPAVGYPMYIL